MGNRGRTMGNKYLSIIIGIVLLLSGLTLFVSTPVLGSINEDQARDIRTPDSDNSFNTATALSNYTLYPGSVDTNDDLYDYYKINLTSNTTHGDLLSVAFTLDSYWDVVYIWVFNPEKYLLIHDIYSPGSDGDFNSSICACTKGYYYIVIRAYFGETGYGLTVYNHTIQRTIDSDNSNNTADVISAGAYSRTLNATYDYLDLFNISITHGTTTTWGVTIEISKYSDFYLALYTPGGTLRELTYYDTIKFAADMTGVYRIAVGVRGEPEFTTGYYLNITITTNVPVDLDYNKDNAKLVYAGTKLNSSFNSEFDIYDWYMIDLDANDELTVSLVYLDGTGDTDINIYDKDGNWVNDYSDSDSEIGCWASSQVEKTGRYYIEVENWWDWDIYLGNYTILFSLEGKNLWFKPMIKNDTNLDFSMLEDTIDISHVNLTDIFYDSDSPIYFSSPSHPGGMGANINIDILSTGAVEFKPHQDFNGYEIINFSARDIDWEYLYWEVNVTVLPVNDAPVIDQIEDQTWTQGTLVNLTLNISDVDDTKFNISDNTTLFEVNNSNMSINFTPTNDDVGIHYLNITVTDGEANTSMNFTAEIKNINDPPKIIKIGGKIAVPGGVIELNATEDEWNNFTVEATDIDHEIGVVDDLEFFSNKTDSTFAINRNTGNISFFPLQEHVGVYKLRITVRDSYDASDHQDINITVLNINDAPTKPTVSLKNISGLIVTCFVQEVFDEDGDTLNYSWNFGDGTGTVIMGLNGNHTYDEPGDYTITVTVTDGNGGISKGSMVINKTAFVNVTDNVSEEFVDVDEDNLDDNWELYYFKDLSQGAKDDFDSDGYLNYEEYLKKTDPTNPYDYPPVVSGDGEDTGYSDMEILLAIGLIANFVIIIIIILFMLIRKKPVGAEVEGRAAWPEKDRFTVPCPECGRAVSESDRECPYCGEELEPGYEYDKYDEEARPKQRVGRQPKDRGRERTHPRHEGKRRPKKEKEEEYESEEPEWEIDEDEEVEPEEEYEEEYYEEEPEADEELDEEYDDEEEYDDDDEYDEDEGDYEDDDDRRRERYEDEEYYEDDYEPDEAWEEDYAEEQRRSRRGQRQRQRR